MYLISLVFLNLLCFAAAISDIHRRQIPDSLIKSGIFLRLLTSFVCSVFFVSDLLAFLEEIFSALFFGTFFFFVSISYKRMTGKPAFGGGDIKLLFMVCLFFSFSFCLKLILFSLVLASAAGLVYRLLLKRSGMPFAPAVFAAVFGILILG